MGNSKEEEYLENRNKDDKQTDDYVLNLFVTGATTNSTRAIANIKRICENYLKGRYSLEIIDVYKHKEAAQQEQLVALPMLVKCLPLPKRKLIGDLSNNDKVLEALGLK